MQKLKKVPGIWLKVRKNLFYQRNKWFTTYLKTVGASVGKNSIVYRTVDVQNIRNLWIGQNCIIYKNVSIYIGDKGQFKMSDHSHIAPYCYFLIDNNRMEIGKHVAIGPFCSFFCHSNSYSKDERLFTKNYIDGDITIGSNVFIGSHSVIQANSVIEDDVIIGANSVVKGHFKSGYVYAGMPLRAIKKIESN